MLVNNDLFSTPQRAERFDLLQHLIRNTDQLIYVRGPEGIGKTTFARQLQDVMSEQYQVVSLISPTDTEIITRTAQVVDCAPTDDHWVVEHFDRSVLIIVDQADQLNSAALQALLNLHGRGCRIAFFGEGDFNAAVTLPAIQYIDIPAFDAEQMVEFFVGRGHIGLDEKVISQVYRETGGVPGLLLAISLNEGHSPSQPTVKSATPTANKTSLLSGELAKKISVVPRWALISIGALLLLLFFQDEINGLFVAESIDETANTSILKVPERVKKKPLMTDNDVNLSQNSQKIVRQSAVAVIDEPVSLTQIPSAIGELDEPLMIEEVITAQAMPKEEKAKEKIEETIATEFQAELDAEAQKFEISPPSIKRPTVKEKKQVLNKNANSWLMSQAASAYTLQLVAARDRASLDSFLKKHKITLKTAIFKRNLKGKLWYSLIAGSFPNRELALKAKSKLPQTLRKTDVWPRTFGSIHVLIDTQKAQ